VWFRAVPPAYRRVTSRKLCAGVTLSGISRVVETVGQGRPGGMLPARGSVRVSDRGQSPGMRIGTWARREFGG